MEAGVSYVALLLGVLTVIASAVVWPIAARRNWVDSDRFISHISMAALVLGGFAMLISALSALFTSH